MNNDTIESRPDQMLTGEREPFSSPFPSLLPSVSRQGFGHYSHSVNQVN